MNPKLKRLFDKLNEQKRKIERENRHATADELAEAESIMDQIDAIQTEQRMNRTLEWPHQTPADSTQYRTDPGGGRETATRKFTGPKNYNSLGEQLKDIVSASLPNAGTPERLVGYRAASGASEGVLSDGGFLVQSDFQDELLSDVFKVGQVAKYCRRIPISARSNSLKFNAIDETSRADGSRWGGLLSYWAAEAETVTATKPKLRQMELKLKKLFCLMYATEEMVQDSVALDAYAKQVVPQELAFQVDEAIIEGSGAGEPLGIKNSGALVEQEKETGQAATTLIAENVEKMYSRLLPGSTENAVWFINQDVWPQIFQFNHSVGTGGVPLFIPQGGMSRAPHGTIFGRPVVPIEHCETLGTKGDIYLADLSYYLLIDKGGIRDDVSMHVRFLYDEMTFRWILRIDGQPLLSSAITPKNSTNTLSPFVTLEARAS